MTAEPSHPVACPASLLVLQPSETLLVVICLVQAEQTMCAAFGAETVDSRVG